MVAPPVKRPSLPSLEVSCRVPVKEPLMVEVPKRVIIVGTLLLVVPVGDLLTVEVWERIPIVRTL